ncbi:DUF1631 family protein [Ideonella sp. YS5]|uniref:DUF1631 family protein n=1 Tax=Ideonella sp. YS5 TaxID=3453714 RepID=UPI003EE8A65E
MTAPPPAVETLYQRYLAQCQADAAAVVARVCREAGVASPGGGLWVSPAQRHAQSLLPGLAPRWLAQLARPVAAPSGPTLPQPFVTDGFGVPTGLALMSDDDVDEEIESTRVVQAIESAAEWSLRDLRSRLASAPPTAGSLEDEVLPLAPARLVSALCGALHEETDDGAARLAALRCAAEPLASALANMYQQHAELLSAWGLQPARYSIRREPEAHRAAAAAGQPRRQETSAVGVAAHQIPALLAHVAGEAGLSAGMQALMSRLAGPVARSVAADPGLLDSLDNPLWRLIDRLAAIGQLDTEGAAGGFELPLHLRLEPIIAALEQTRQAMPLERYAQALAEAEAQARGVADHTVAPVPDPAPVPFHVTGLAIAPTAPGGLSAPAPAAALPEGTLAHIERRQALEPLVRGQMVARLREANVLPAVKQFLLGPWVASIVQVIAAHGDDSAPAQRALNAVEALIEGGSYTRRSPLSPAELDCLRLEAADGLAATPGLPSAHAKQHVQDLVAALSLWPRPAPAADTSMSADDLLGYEDEPLEQTSWPAHDELATVPIALDAHNPDERSLRACESWLDGLAVGDICRVQRQGQWATLRLNWRSDNGAYFAFGNSTGLAFCASRRVLGRMRLEGLATTMARGQWVRRAADTLPMPLE